MCFTFNEQSMLFETLGLNSRLHFVKTHRGGRGGGGGVQCVAGEYSAGASVCIKCEAGKFSAANASTVCTDCVAGKYSAAASTVCVACVTTNSSGRYKDSAGDANCDSFPST